ncbi:MAG: OsmC family protein [Desulfurococcales archaeon]|nr:OsmC family protein [Desulfurococcales archaeon]
MEKMEIPPVKVGASYSVKDNLVKVTARGVVVEVGELPEHGGRGDRITPLEAFLAGLASCEVFMFKHVAKAMGIKEGYDVEVNVRGDFEFGEGLKHMDLEVKVRGLDRETAEKVFELVKNYCPVYNSIKKMNAVVHEKIIVE